MNFISSTLLGVGAAIFIGGSVAVAKRLASWILTRDDRKTIYLKNPSNGERLTVIVKPNMTKKETTDIIQQINNQNHTGKPEKTVGRS